ncbi:hypothetical protein [Wolbachia endosymbiont (group A) of Ennomos erosarius]|uniref:hypothetical protein n=1 Tax=Wolbachia endosymbiont (group A) of Ennomos erosarius TaxID=3066174 RepID=UPI0033400B6E
MPFKHNHIPCQDNHHSHFKHCHQPCHSSHDAAWYHAHDSGNTVVVNIPPYYRGIGTGMSTHEVTETEAVSLDHFKPTAAAEII